jgi:hypothetical protein
VGSNPTPAAQRAENGMVALFLAALQGVKLARDAIPSFGKTQSGRGAYLDALHANGR